MKLVSIIFLTVLVGLSSQGLDSNLDYTPVKPKYDIDYLVQFTLEAKGFIEKPEIKRPEILFGSEVSLTQFQDDVEPQWGIRPEFVTNVYVVSKNRIYLLDDKAYYDKLGRCIDDSIVHELTHFVQSAYQGFDLDDESLEFNAIDIQIDFREKHCNTGHP